MLPVLRSRSSYRRLLTPGLRPQLALRTTSRPSPISIPRSSIAPQLELQLSASQARTVHTGPLPQQPQMSNEPKVDLAKFLDPTIPSCVYTLWFQHVANDHNLTLPTPEVFKPWFTKDATFDLQCSTQFKPILAAIHQARPELNTPTEVEAQAQQILDLVEPASALDWLGLVILLDQLPRNCYRGPEAALVYSFFDPIARVIATKALDLGIPTSNPDIRYRLALRHWFYLPFMHSEDIKDQELVLEKYEEMDADFRSLLDQTPAGELGQKELACREVLAQNREAVEAVSKQNLKFQKEHHDIIARFGRYPYRNGVLGRQTTEEEAKFLKEANISFG